MSFNRIAYEALDVCNPATLAMIDRALAEATLEPGDQALDIGCGNATVAIHLAGRHGLAVTAVERDPLMADLARARIGQRAVTLVQDDAATLLGPDADLDLIVVMGATDAAGGGERDPTRVFQRLAASLKPGGVLLWGEPFWAEEPSPQFRLIIELTNHYQTREGWEAAAQDAGLEVVSRQESDAETWAAYVAGVDGAVRAWVDRHPEAPESRGLIARADGVKSLFEEEGARVLGFGLWLFRRPV